VERDRLGVAHPSWWLYAFSQCLEHAPLNKPMVLVPNRRGCCCRCAGRWRVRGSVALATALLLDRSISRRPRSGIRLRQRRRGGFPR
jgi:hypothetical protein